MTLIEDYALIGDCETAALVGRDGSIDWLCWPRFDSGACFAALLGSPANGRWLIAPTDASPRVTRRYREGTLILETEFTTATGRVTLIDFMPPRHSASDLVRIIVGEEGRVDLRTELILRFDYGSVVPWVTRLGPNRIQATAGPDSVTLDSDVPLHGEDMRTVGEFTIEAGQTVSFVLAHSPSHLPVPDRVDPARALSQTDYFWRDWSSRCTYEGKWADAVLRSHIVLKALTYAPTGGIVAAPTTSLPEWIGGPRNWDYRYCWLRDATLTLLSLMNAGYFEEAQHWRKWLMRALAGNPADAQIMYGIAGERRLPEMTLDWLPGYENSRPVRIGNAAAGQLQLDVFGEVMDALHQARQADLEGSTESWALERSLIDRLEEIWSLPDEGIWEVRGEQRHFTHSKVMAWVAFDRMIRSAEEFGFEGPVGRWRMLRERIHQDVCEKAWNEQVGAFTQSYGSDTLDASVLVMPLVGFISPDDPRMRATVSAIEQRLMRDGFVLRYDSGKTDDGLPEGEGAFLACSFWLADNLFLQKRYAEAEELFERLLAIRNDVGLLAEEYDPAAKRQLGNFPQAFSHLALAETAMNMGSRHKPVEQRGGAKPR
ncbi:glycoside hydrolase family 15 protein [Altericroceibacterium xinjiangense]|uniref:glycoside hydrolase family 15 protein n=1 Tax=Altericroceibacterium xinjiangense TaxID=762261 RepID=UPI000F7F38A9|nr:glycoside hydrolase family 15 protein [Altericroceibacterium xinjiangense]